MSVDITLFDRIGGSFSLKTMRERGLGGSECELLQVAHGLADHGHKVALCNGVDKVFEEDGVLYVPHERLEQYLPSRALYIQRMSVPSKPIKLPSSVRVVVRANDIYVPEYDRHKYVLENGLAALVTNTKWQADGFPFGKEKIVIPPILGDSPFAYWPDQVKVGKAPEGAVVKEPGLFVFGSGFMKGLPATIKKWHELKKKHGKVLQKARLVILSPGWGDPPRLTDADKAARISYEGSPTPEIYRQWIAKAEGLFTVLQMFEVFMCAAALAERSGTRTHILSRHGLGGIPEAVVNHTLLTTDDAKFEKDFMEAWQSSENRDRWYADEVPDRSAAAIIPQWEEALRLTKGIVQVPASIMDDKSFIDEHLKHCAEKAPHGCTLMTCPRFIGNKSQSIEPTSKVGQHVEFYKVTGGDTAQRYWAHDQVLVGGQIVDERCVEVLKKQGVTHVLSFAHEPGPDHDDHLWPEDKRYRAPFPDLGQMLSIDLIRGAVEWVEKVFSDNPDAVLYAHCRLGGSRGPSAAYLACRVLGLKPPDAMESIKAGHSYKAQGWLPHGTYIQAIEEAFARVDRERVAGLLNDFKARLIYLERESVDATVTDYWRGRCQAQIEFAKTKPIDSFLSWSDDVHMHELPLFAPWYKALQSSTDWPRWEKLSRKTPYGNPHPFSLDAGTSPVTLQHVYHLMRYEELTRTWFDENVDVVIEVGGGYGNFSRMLRADGYKGTHVTIDLPHQREFQRVFLGLNRIRTKTEVDLSLSGVCLLVEKDIPELFEKLEGKRVAFLATWSLSETPIAFREKLFPALHKYCTRYLMATQWPAHGPDGIDNAAYFDDFMREAKKNGVVWKMEIVKHHEGSRYLFGAKDAIESSDTVGLSCEQNMPVEEIAANKEPLGPFFGDFLSQLRTAIQVGGSEYGLGLCLFSLVASTRPEVVVEIGRFKGFSSLALAGGLKLIDTGWQECKAAEQRPEIDYAKFLAPKKRRLISIDPFPAPEAVHTLAHAGLLDYVEMVNKRSDDPDYQPPHTIDFLLIDGSHLFADVCKDIDRYVPRVKPGGYVVMHDYYGWFDKAGNNGSPIKKAIEAMMEGLERILIDTGFASFVVFRKNAELKDSVIDPAPPRADGRPTVGLIMIAKGDEASTVIARAVVSIKDQVDAMTIVVDPHNSSQTVAVCRALGVQVHLRPSPEVDWKLGNGTIARARNEAITIAERRTDYLAMLDPDDIFEGTIPGRLTADCFDVMIHDGGMRYNRCQIFRSGIGFHYEGIRHEVLIAPQGAVMQPMESLIYKRVGGGYQDQVPLRQKYLIHARDLEKWLIDHPDDSRAAFYLAQSLNDSSGIVGGGRDPILAQRALDAYERRIAIASGWEEERYYSAFVIALITMDTGKDPTTAFLRAHELNPNRAEPLVRLAAWLRDEKQKRYKQAYVFAKMGAELTANGQVPGGIFVDSEIYQWKALGEYGICSYWAGRKQEAVAAFEQVVQRIAHGGREWAERTLAMCRSMA